MIFKQSIIKEEKIKFIILISSVLFPYLGIIVFNFVYLNDKKSLMMFMLMILLPIFLLMVLLALKNLEWFEVYEDKLVAKCIFGIKNKVFWNDVLFVQEVTINLTNRGCEKKFYIFNDGRKNNNSFLDLNSCYNKKRFNLRIYKTTALENYIINILKLNIKQFTVN